MFHHTSTCENQYTCCDVISRALCHAGTYPADTQKGVADLCLYQLQSNVQMHVHTGIIKIFLLCSYRYVDTYS